MKKSVNEIITDQIIESLEGDIIPWRKPWSGIGLPTNAISGKAYQGINLFMLGFMNPYGSNVWLTYKQTKNLGGSVKRGEHGSKAVFYSEAKKKTADSESEKETYFFAKMYTVFNVEQTESVTLPAKIQNRLGISREHEPIQEGEAIISRYLKKTGITVKESDGKAYYSTQGDYIGMPKKTTFHDIEGYYNTFFHEMGHSTGAEKRLNREIKNSFGEEKYSREELVAEITASFLAAKTGIHTKTIENSKAYIQNWLKALKSDSKMVMKAASQAQKAFEYIV
jgi:antirestriction protein ArdC